MDKKAKKPIKFKVVKPKSKPTPKMEEKKKKFKVVKIADRKLDALKKKAEEQTKKDGIKRRVLPTGEVQKKKTKPAPKKKKIKFVVKKKEEPKPKPVSELERVAGVTREQAKKMDTAELFGKLPVELRKIILDPKITGVKVGMIPPLPKDLAQELNSVVNEIINFEGFYSYFYGWTYYEGGNFKKAAHEYFEKKANQLNNHSYDEIISDLFEKYTKLPSVIKSTIREYNMTHYSDSIDRLIETGEAPRYNEDWKYNNEYEDYNVEYRYGLNWEDGDYYTTNKTKSTVNSLVKDVNDESKREKKVAKQVAKDIEKFMKANKLN